MFGQFARTETSKCFLAAFGFPYRLFLVLSSGYGVTLTPRSRTLKREGRAGDSEVDTVILQLASNFRESTM